jgi:hypothetical protein
MSGRHHGRAVVTGGANGRDALVDGGLVRA